MIVQKAYKDGRLTYRAYLGDKIIWDCGTYTSGVAEAAMLGFAMAQTETPLDIQMCASANAILSALARAIPIFNGELEADGTMGGSVSAESVTPVDAELHASAVMQGFAYGYTFGLVFTSGVASGQMKGIAYAHPADVTPTSGNVAAKMTGTANADTVDVLNLLLPSNGAGIGTVSAKPQTPLSVKMAASGAMTGSCGAVSLPVHTVTFKVDGEIEHQESVIHGYACPDPVETGKMDKPTKAMTVSHTYEHDSWEAEAGSGSGSEIPILETQPVDGFAYNDSIGFFRTNAAADMFNLEPGKSYRVDWDGDTFTCNAYKETLQGYECVFLGNEAYMTGESEDITEPFLLYRVLENGYCYMASLDSDTSHTVGIYQAGSSIGDPLSCVTQDIVVHPTFTEHIRYYTVRFFDDGELVDTDSVPYCGTAVTDYMREGFNQVEWFPSNENIIGDTDCHGKFTKISFADATWDEINEIAASGNASSFFSLGEEKTIDINYADGTTEPLTFAVAGFDNGKVEGGSTGRLVLVAKHALNKKRAYQSKWVNQFLYYHRCELDTWLSNDFYNALPADLQNVIKSKCINYGGDYRKCWLLSLEELNLSKTNFSGYGTALPIFTSNASRIRNLGASGAATTYLTRNYKSPTYNGSLYIANITETGTVVGGSSSSGYTTQATEHGVVVGIVI